jgi:hypothetical protein
LGGHLEPHAVLATLLAELERVPERAMLLVNAGLGAFVFVAHGGALLLVLGGRVPIPPDYAALVRTLVPFTLPIAGLVTVGSVVALVWQATRRVVLCLQAILLLFFGVGLLAWSVSILIQGIPPGNFAWTPGFLTLWVTYAVFLTVRFALPDTPRKHPSARYVIVLAAVVALPVDLGVFLRFLLRITAM